MNTFAIQIQKRMDNALTHIQSVIKSFIFFLQPKFKIAIDHSGSGNTKNIGGIADLEKMINGQGPFVERFGDKVETVFDDYWMNCFNVQRCGGEPFYEGLTTIFPCFSYTVTPNCGILPINVNPLLCLFPIVASCLHRSSFGVAKVLHRHLLYSSASVIRLFFDKITNNNRTTI